mmetsp:Transcript_24420/g.56762  ORF Transcript_24420/g.56762 Transcript_24420/m.56762 type:complete len:298 (-) Transcript_24420:772-1665(-)
MLQIIACKDVRPSMRGGWREAHPGSCLFGTQLLQLTLLQRNRLLNLALRIVPPAGLLLYFLALRTQSPVPLLELSDLTCEIAAMPVHLLTFSLQVEVTLLRLLQLCHKALRFLQCSLQLHLGPVNLGVHLEVLHLRVVSLLPGLPHLPSKTGVALLCSRNLSSNGLGEATSGALCFGIHHHLLAILLQLRCTGFQSLQLRSRTMRHHRCALCLKGGQHLLQLGLLLPVPAHVLLHLSQARLQCGQLLCAPAGVLQLLKLVDLLRCTPGLRSNCFLQGCYPVRTCFPTLQVLLLQRSQ